MSELHCAYCHAVITDTEPCIEVLPQMYTNEVPLGFAHIACIMPYLMCLADAAWRRRKQTLIATPKEN